MGLQFIKIHQTAAASGRHRTGCFSILQCSQIDKSSRQRNSSRAQRIPALQQFNFRRIGCADIDITIIPTRRAEKKQETCSVPDNPLSRLYNTHFVPDGSSEFSEERRKASGIVIDCGRSGIEDKEFAFYENLQKMKYNSAQLTSEQAPFRTAHI